MCFVSEHLVFATGKKLKNTKNTHENREEKSTLTFTTTSKRSHLLTMNSFDRKY